MRDSGADLMFVASTDYAFFQAHRRVYFNVGYVRNKGVLQLRLNGFNASSGGRVDVVPGDNQTGVVLGMRHKF